MDTPQTGSGSTNGTGWQVTGQSPTTVPSPSGTVERGMNVTFRTSTGVLSTVFVPDSMYTPDNVKNIIAQKAAVLDQVSGLKG